MLFDPRSEYGAMVQRRLAEEDVIWLTTVGRDGTPHPRPVWFWWDGGSFLIYSQPNTGKLRDPAGNTRVALNFDSDGNGGDIVVFIGRAEYPARPSEKEMNAYLDKYRDGIADIGFQQDTFLESYSNAIRIKPERMYGE